MGTVTGISWADSTFNPWRGCTKVSPACRICYADSLAKRSPLVLGKWGDEGTRVVAAEGMWKMPLKWNAEAYAQKCRYETETSIEAPRPRVFCASMADVFEDWQGMMMNPHGQQLCICHGCHEFVTFLEGCSGEDVLCERLPAHLKMSHVRARLFELIDTTPYLDWLLLTKRPENILGMCPGIMVACQVQADDRNERGELYRRNVWLGTTVENQEYADKRIPELLKCRDLAPVLFLSVEPMLGPVDLGEAVGYSPEHGGHFDPRRPRVDWVIVGCESGATRKPTDLAWVRSLRDQCQVAGVAFFVKQLEINGTVTDDVDAFPEDLRVQQLPKVRA